MVIPLIIAILGFCAQSEEEIIISGSDHPLISAAQEFIKAPFRYDFSMGYHRLTYRNGVNTGSFVYPEGDLSPDIGVCTDLIIRVFRKAGYDLQQKLHQDAKNHFSSYPYHLWNMSKPDPNIDHRRVPMLNAFFKRHAQSLTIETTPDKLDQWQAGDIVIWDLTGKGKLDHIGIVSDKRIKANNRPLVIDNFPDPGYVYEGDRLQEWTIRAHYRFPVSLLKN